MAVEEVLAPCAPRGAAAAHGLAPWIISPFARKLGVDLAHPFCPAPACLWDEDDDLHNWELVDSCKGSEIVAKPSSNGGLNQEEWPSEDMPQSWNGGLDDTHIDSHVIGAPEYLSAQVSLYLQTVLSAACEDVQDGSVFSYPNAVTLDIGARGSVPSDVVTVPHQVYCEGTNWNTSKVSQKDCGAPGSEPDKTDWQQQQQQQVEGTHATLNDVNGLHLIGVDPRLSGASGTAGDKGWPPVFQGKMETIATNLWEISANSGSVICEAECKIISGLAAAEYLIEQHLVIDNAVLGKQLRNGVWAISSPEQKGAGQIGEPEDHSTVPSGHGSPVAGEHGISLAPKKTDPATAWLIASAAPHHATGNRALLSGFAPDQGDLFVKAGDAGAAPMRVAGHGNVVTDAVVLPDVWYVPGLTANVVSVSQIAELDYSVAFGHGQCYVRSGEDGVVVGTARAGEDGLFALDFIRVPLGI